MDAIKLRSIDECLGRPEGDFLKALKLKQKYLQSSALLKLVASRPKEIAEIDAAGPTRHGPEGLPVSKHHAGSSTRRGTPRR